MLMRVGTMETRKGGTLAQVRALRLLGRTYMYNLTFSLLAICFCAPIVQTARQPHQGATSVDCKGSHWPVTTTSHYLILALLLGILERRGQSLLANGPLGDPRPRDFNFKGFQIPK